MGNGGISVLDEGLLETVFRAREPEFAHLRLESDRHQRLWSSSSDAGFKRTLYVTDNEHAGSTMGVVQEGDLLGGLFGIMFPFFLRKSENGTYTMVSVASVVNHQLSDGSSPGERFTIV